MKQASASNSDEVSIKGIILRFISIWVFIKRKWVFIVICGLFGFIVGLGYSFMRKPVYTARCTFVLEEGSKTSGALSQYAGLASMAGIDIGGSGGGIFQGDNIIELYKSRLMIEKTLLSVVSINNRTQLLLDRYIEFNKLRDKWNEVPSTKNISFHNSPNSFSRVQDSIITNIVTAFNKKSLVVTKLDKKLSIIEVVFQSKDEFFAKEFTTKLVENVNGFYINTKTRKTLKNVLALQKRTDSVKAILNSSIHGVASSMDATPNANPTLLTLRVPSQQKQIDVQANAAMYGEVVKNLEMSKFSLQQETPLIQVIDLPVLPLSVDKPNKIVTSIIGFFLGGIFIILFFLLKRAYTSLMSD